ncbi:Vps73p [Saccharomyces cerevisiae YJM1573]|uniref:Vacuolar sorting protein n=1 Tax=Saccharomyces cerevisiae (strain YJM789) TaxID=307796 RepID=A6ZU77_YEAS7|nr:Vps73p [Saccharomyces cerevisiae YJM456]AJR95339.1 Vps73p [Saccharomyces cerevisiae YJM1208]AJS02682.1 Vps73p [Saccharomyces cerevisiae YJM1447]AJS05606.1 Vps73p [Saccharomyces cerevisiae YJM1479]AJS07595.1 Vps73p [Saccharomyces cerevisiae YJM1573]AJS09017.1 Vps73p [Saccharomyces cerevisiae YJM1615]AJS28679.1 Vps73p [Saccharomyces cerevisiae YJM1400]AJS29671.1 Vps73p [Saccharomyces cerevisiae YJM1402]EDN62015.1 vacuolar sorting protein [Saccharomyces cerevisiae YJM789]KZV11123.1 VPS73 [
MNRILSSASLLSNVSMPRQNKHKITKALCYAIIVASIGSIQFGYHLSELNAPQQVLSCSEFDIPMEGYPYDRTWLGKRGYKQCIPLNDEQIGIVTSVFCIGGILGSYFATSLANIYGRKFSSLINCTLNIVGSLIIFNSNSYRGLIIGRILVGISCGSLIVIIPLFIKEVAPSGWEGLLGSMTQICIRLGVLLTQGIALPLTDSYRWRWILFGSFLIAVLNFFMWFIVDESPKWLLAHGRVTDAKLSLCKLRGVTFDEAAQEIQDWQLQIESGDPLIEPTTTNSISGSNSLWKYLRDRTNVKSRHVITVLLFGQQFCGINSIVLYGTKIISQLYPQHAIRINFFISMVNVLVTILVSLLIHSLPRKPLLMTSTVLVSVTAFIMGIAMNHNKMNLLIVFSFIYMGVFTMGLNPLPFIIMREISKPQDMVLAQRYGTICNWVGTFIIAYTFPIIHDVLSGYVFIIFAIIACSISAFIWKKVPETKRSG